MCAFPVEIHVGFLLASPVAGFPASVSLCTLCRNVTISCTRFNEWAIVHEYCEKIMVKVEIINMQTSLTQRRTPERMCPPKPVWEQRDLVAEGKYRDAPSLCYSLKRRRMIFKHSWHANFKFGVEPMNSFALLSVSHVPDSAWLSLEMGWQILG